MSSAEPRKNPEPRLPSNRAIDEKGQQYHRQDDRLSLQANSPRRRLYRLWSKDKMPSFRRSCLAILIVAFMTMTYASGPVNQRPQDPTADQQATFQDLLNSVSDASLHNVLKNVYDKYKHGVFMEDRTAMKAVHSENAAVATSLIELARRQNPNATSVSPDTLTTVTVVGTTTQTNTVIQASGTNTGVVVQTQTTVTSVETSVAPVQTTAPQASATSSAQAFASTHGTTTAKGTTSPVATTFRTSSAGTASTSPGQFESSSSAASSATIKSSSTRQIIFTTTMPNGSQSTVTSYTVVPAGEQASTPGVTAPSMTVGPSLQNGAPDVAQPSGLSLVGSLAAALVLLIGIL